MPQNEKIEGNSEAGSSRRFRLPKLFADSNETSPEDAAAAARDVAERASALGVTLPPVITQETLSAANQNYEGSPRAAVLKVPAETVARPKSPSAPAGSGATDVSQDNLPASASATTYISGPLPPETTTTKIEPKPAAVATQTNGDLLAEIQVLRDNMEEMHNTLLDMYDRGDAQDKVFNTLHSELQDYKNDFIYEHLKPVVRPLLFLFDSMEHFDEEMARHDRPQPQERRQGFSPHLVRENVSFFREQLVEALRICEVTPMQKPEGEFDPRLHKAVNIVEVADDQHNVIQRVVRSGWYLNGRVFRHADVVVGKKSEDYNALVSNYGKGSS